MPRQPTEDQGGDVHEDQESSPSKITKTKLNRFIKAIRAEQKEIDAFTAECKAECAPHRQEITKLMKEAAEAGLPKKEFALILKKRKIEFDLEHLDSELDKKQKETFQEMLIALGDLADTPLGQAAAGTAH